MANWLNPTLTTNYDVFLAEAKERDIDAMTMCLSTPTNTPVGTIRWNRATFLFEEWSGTVWNTLTLSLLGGGTGATTPAAIRTALGLGTLSAQNSNNINVSAGSIAGLTHFDTACHILGYAPNTYDLGLLSWKWRKCLPDKAELAIGSVGL